MLKRVSMDSRGVDEEARARQKHQSLLQDFLELQKDFVAKKKKLQTAKQKRATLLAEVRFLRRRHKHLLKIRSAELEREQDCIQPQKSVIESKMHAKGRHYSITEASLEDRSPVFDPKVILGAEDEGGSKELVIREPLRVDKKPKNCLINDKRVGKKKISWQDQVALKV